MVMAVNSGNNTQGYNYQRDVRAGGMAALLGGSAVNLIKAPFGTPTLNAFEEANNFSSSELEELRKAGKTILEKEGLAAKGVKIKYLENNLPKAKTLEDLKLLFNEHPTVLMIKMGKNAAFAATDVKWYNILTKEKIFVEKGNTVLMPESALQGSLVHELGHSHNFNFGKILKFMQYLRPAGMFLPPLLLIYGAFSKKSKPKNGNTELTGAQKANNFVRDNAGKLSFLAFLPTLIEEAAATIKGHKFAKKYLTESIANRTLKGNCIAYTTYLMTGILGALAARTAVKIKDKKIAKKEAELQQQAAFMNAQRTAL